MIIEPRREYDAPLLPLLVTGVTGVAGYDAWRFLRERFPGQVFGIQPLQNQRLSAEGLFPLDVADQAGLANLFRTHQFRSVLNCVGNCALKACELDPDMARRLNVNSLAILLAVSRPYRVRLVHLSTDLVFSGKGTGNYVETDPLDPVTVYGKTMAESEAMLGETAPETAILRIALPMGPSVSGHAGAIDWINSRFRAGRPATLYFDELRSCTYVEDLSRVFLEFLGNDASGIYHLGAPRPMTLHQIGQVVNRVGGYAPELLKGCLRVAAGPMPPRAGNVSMCSDKLVKLLGRQPFQPWPTDPELTPTDPLWHFQRGEGEIGSFQRIRERLYLYSKSEDGKASSLAAR